MHWHWSYCSLALSHWYFSFHNSTFHLVGKCITPQYWVTVILSLQQADWLPVPLQRGRRRPLKFDCEHCGKKFRTPYHLRRHDEDVHQGIRNLACPACGRRFAQKHHLKSHMLSAHRQLMDPNADYRFDEELARAMMQPTALGPRAPRPLWDVCNVPCVLERPSVIIPWV